MNVFNTDVHIRVCMRLQSQLQVLFFFLSWGVWFAKKSWTGILGLGKETPSPQGCIRMADNHRRSPPSPTDQSDDSGKKRSLPSGKSCQAVFGTQTIGSQTPPPTPPPSLLMHPCLSLIVFSSPRLYVLCRGVQMWRYYFVCCALRPTWGLDPRSPLAESEPFGRCTGPQLNLEQDEAPSARLRTSTRTACGPGSGAPCVAPWCSGTVRHGDPG